MNIKRSGLILALTVTFYSPADAQSGPTTYPPFKTVVAGPEYDRSAFHNWLWGKHYRKEWITPVSIHEMILDTVAGGLTPYKAGGSRQSKTLRLHNPKQQEFVLRSVDKDFGNALPPIYRNTFVEGIINDQVSTAHPYSAVTVSPMAAAADIYHTNPQLAYVPKQPALDSFSENYGDKLYILEQRPDEDWTDADNFANSDKIISTYKLFNKMRNDADNRVDQQAFIKARLFDMLIGDWGRHEDQWRWAKTKQGKTNLYEPIPRDRDQAYTKFDGVATKFALSLAGAGYLQSFNYKIKDPKTFSYPARNLDRRMANETTLEDWTNAASEIQKALTDAVIDDAVKQMPQEVYPISGPEIAAKIKSRRDHLGEYAEEYYKFLAEEVEITGTKGSDYFEVKRLNDGQTSVEVFNIKKDGDIERKPYYSRVFQSSETKEIRLFGFSGHDKYFVSGDVNTGILVRIIGGHDRDVIVDSSYVAHGTRKTRVYDDENNDFTTSNETKLHLKYDSLTHEYKYDDYYYDKRGMKISFSYNNADRFYIRVGYRRHDYEWGKAPFGYESGIYLAYSLNQSAFSLLYDGTFNQLVGKWNLKVNLFADAIRWQNFYGLGNETKSLNSALYYRMRTSEFNGYAGLQRDLSPRSSFAIGGFLQLTTIINDKDRYVTDYYPAFKLNAFDEYWFAGLQADYTYQNLDDRIIPTKGISINANATYKQDFTNPDRSFLRYGGIVRLYVPLVAKFSLCIYTGAYSVTNSDAEFFELPTIGGSINMRGFRRERFRGQTAFWDSNELRWITNARTHIMNGKVGLVGFVDDGRVWEPGENSSTLHVGYGGGVLIAPFNKFMLTATYGISNESKLIHLRFTKPI